MATKKAATPKPKNGFRTIRVTSAAYEQVHKIVGDVNLRGWEHYGISRRDSASITSVVVEAVTLLAKAKAAR